MGQRRSLHRQPARQLTAGPPATQRAGSRAEPVDVMSRDRTSRGVGARRVRRQYVVLTWLTRSRVPRDPGSHWRGLWAGMQRRRCVSRCWRCPCSPGELLPIHVPRRNGQFLSHRIDSAERRRCGGGARPTRLGAWRAWWKIARSRFHQQRPGTGPESDCAVGTETSGGRARRRLRSGASSRGRRW